jgi:hypothetical protein
LDLLEIRFRSKHIRLAKRTDRAKRSENSVKEAKKRIADGGKGVGKAIQKFGDGGSSLKREKKKRVDVHSPKGKKEAWRKTRTILKKRQKK